MITFNDRTVNPWGEIWDILPSFCQISHTSDQREILLSHNILKYLNQNIYWRIVQQKNTIFGIF